MKKQDWIAVILVGILLLVVALPAKEEAGGYKNNYDFSEKRTESASGRRELEEELSGILTAMNGVGRVKVMITMKERTGSYFGETTTGEVEGVVVVAEGGDNAVVANEILEVVLSLFPVEAHKITIVKMNQSEA